MARSVALSMLLFLVALSWRVSADVDATPPGSREVLVVADAARGPALSQLFRAVLEARIRDVDVRFVSEDAWRALTPRPEPALLFQLDTSSDAVWTLRLVQTDRTWQRRLHGVARDPAAIEAAALIAARASVALLTREVRRSPERPEELTAWTTKQMASAAPEPPSAAAKPSAPREPAPAASEAPEVDRGVPADRAARQPNLGLRFLGAYRGAAYAAEVPWTHGAHLAAVLELRDGPCAEAGYTYTPAVTLRSEFGSFDVMRYPAELAAGWCFRRGRFGVSPKLGVLAEPTRRHTTVPRAGVGVSESSTRVGWAGVTALGADWEPSERIRVYLGLSAAYYFSDLEYVAEGSESPLLSPYDVQLRVDVGAQLVAF